MTATIRLDPNTMEHSSYTKICCDGAKQPARQMRRARSLVDLSHNPMQKDTETVQIGNFDLMLRRSARRRLHRRGRVTDVGKKFEPAVENAGLSNFRFHDLRHTADKRMAANGTDPFTLAYIFGWSDIRMAMRYTHATTSSMKQEVPVWERVIGAEEAA